MGFKIGPVTIDSGGVHIGSSGSSGKKSSSSPFVSHIDDYIRDVFGDEFYNDTSKRNAAREFLKNYAFDSSYSIAGLGKTKNWDVYYSNMPDEAKRKLQEYKDYLDKNVRDAFDESTRLEQEALAAEEKAKNSNSQKDLLAAQQKREQSNLLQQENDEKYNDTQMPTGLSTNANPADYSTKESSVNVQNAIAQGAQEAQTNAENQARASASAGINKSRAGMLSDSSSQQSQTNNVANNYAANQSQTASTQADYLQKMAQADALDQQASNMNEGAGLTALGAGVSGAATGATTGALVSDERVKEPADDELQNAIKQFRELYKRLQSLKGGK